MELFDRLRNWALKPIVERISMLDLGAVAYLRGIHNALLDHHDDDRRMIQGLVEAISPDEDGTPSPILQILRAEPAMAFKQWLDESKDRDRETRRQFQSREKQLLARWAEHSASQAARIDILERIILKHGDDATVNKGANDESVSGR